MTVSLTTPLLTVKSYFVELHMRILHTEFYASMFVV